MNAEARSNRSKVEPDSARLLDRSSLDAAFIQYYDDIRLAARRRGLDAAGATEVTHDVYINLARQPQTILGKRSLKAFLMAAAANLGIDRLKRRAFEQRLFAELDKAANAPAVSVEPGYNLDREKYVAALKAAIEELPPQCRNVFIAHSIGGLSKDEIAEGLGIRRRMIDRHLRKALLHCTECIGRIC